MAWGQVAAAGIGAASKLLGRKKKSGTPKYIKRAEQFAIGRAQDVATRPYERYSGDRVAGLSENEQLGGNLARAAVKDNQARSYLDRAGTEIGNLSEWSPETAKKYMDPYVDSVVNASLQREGQAYSNDRARIAARASSLNAMGNDRQALQEASLAGEHYRTVGDITSRGYSDAWQDAQRMWLADNDRRLSAARAYSSLGQDINNLNSEQVSDLLRTGQGERLLRQLNLDVDYADFVEQRDWDITNLQPLIQVLGASRGVNTGSTGSKTAALLGAAATAIGYFGSQSKESPVQEVQITPHPRMPEY